MKPVSLPTATTTLRAAFRDIRELARAAEKPRRGTDPPVWSLALDETRDTGVELRPRLPWSGPRDFTGPERIPRRAAAVPVPHAELLEPIKLDALRVADDADSKTQIEAQPNPRPNKTGLA